MRFTIGQIPVKWSSSPAAINAAAAITNLPQRNLRRRLAKPPPRNHSQQHRPQRRNKAQRQIPAAVVRQTGSSAETDSETTRRTPARVAVLVPVRRKAAYKDAAANPAGTPTAA